jgi:hypothetical protein
MENRQLERELKTIIQGLRGDEILRIIDCLEKDHNLILNKNFASTYLLIKNQELIALAVL